LVDFGETDDLSHGVALDLVDLRGIEVRKGGLGLKDLGILVMVALPVGGISQQVHDGGKAALQSKADIGELLHPDPDTFIPIKDLEDRNWEPGDDDHKRIASQFIDMAGERGGGRAPLLVGRGEIRPDVHAEEEIDKEKDPEDGIEGVVPQRGPDGDIVMNMMGDVAPTPCSPGSATIS
jgi:hypothetical protein